MIAIIDDDAATRHSIGRVLRSYGFESLGFESATAFLASGRLDAIDCLISDIRMPGMTGLELQDHLLKAKIVIPIIFITGYVDEAIRADTRKAGTVTVLEKPFDDGVLIAHIQAAIRSRVNKSSIRLDS